MCKPYPHLFAKKDLPRVGSIKARSLKSWTSTTSCLLLCSLLSSSTFLAEAEAASFSTFLAAAASFSAFLAAAADFRKDASRLDWGFLFKAASKEEDPMRLGMNEGPSKGAAFCCAAKTKALFK